MIEIEKLRVGDYSVNCYIVHEAGRKDCVLKIMPPLTIEEDTLLQGLRVLKEAIREALAEMK